MYVDVIGNTNGGVAISYGKVHAESYEAAVAMVFKNKAMYPRVEWIGANKWDVEKYHSGSRIVRIRVRCRLIPKTQPEKVS